MSASLLAPAGADTAQPSHADTNLDARQMVVGSGTIFQHERKQESTLDETEQADLARLIGRFHKIQGAWYECLEILMEIKERRLYRQDHPDFETFCRKVFGMGRSNLNRIIQTAEVANRLATIVAKPERESHVRPLLKLTDANQQVDCYCAARDAAKSAKRPMTAKDVAKAVRAKLPSRSSRSNSPSEPIAADVIARLGRFLIRGLENYPVDALVRFEEKLVQFKNGWCEEELASSHSLTPVIDTNDIPNPGIVVQAVAAIDPAVLALEPPGPEQEQPVGHPASTLAAQAGSKHRSDEGIHALRSQDHPQEVDHTPRLGRRYDVIGVDLEPQAISGGLKALRLHRVMQKRCHVFIKLNGNPSKLVEDAFAGSGRQVHGRIRLDPPVTSDQGQDNRAKTGTVVVVLNGFSRVKKCIPTDVTCAVADNEQWLGAIVNHHSELFPVRFPKRILWLNGTSVSTPEELPSDAGDNQRAKGDLVHSPKDDTVAIPEGDERHE